MPRLSVIERSLSVGSGFSFKCAYRRFGETFFSSFAVEEYVFRVVEKSLGDPALVVLNILRSLQDLTVGWSGGHVLVCWCRHRMADGQVASSASAGDAMQVAM